MLTLTLLNYESFIIDSMPGAGKVKVFYFISLYALHLDSFLYFQY